MKKRKNDTAIYCLGGLGEVGKNSYCIEHEDTIILVDAGVKFAGDNALPGIDYVIPDYTYLKENKDKFKALIITHGHEDHIGGIGFLAQIMELEYIYASGLACNLIRKKLNEKKIRNIKLIEFNNESEFKFGKIKVNFFRQTHSIPDAYGILFKTPNGTIVTTGDFKFDFTPVGDMAEIQKMALMGKNGVDLLLSDSTNSEVPGFTMSEAEVSESINEIFRNTPSRLIIATFASNVSRVQQIIEAAQRSFRKVIIFGRSMENTIDVARKTGIIKARDDLFVKPNVGLKLPPNQILILCTGSQGEPLAALSRIANGSHRQIKIIPNDTVVFSSSPIPGNALSVNHTINQLSKAGANVITNSILNSIHTSGHASQGEQKLMFQLLTPKYFFPVHGEYRMLKAHAKTATEVGIPKENTFILSNGDVLLLHKGEVRLGGRVHSDDIYVDGNDISGLSTKVIRDRVHLANNGLVAIMVSIDSKNNKLLAKPQIISRGFVYMKENVELIRETQKIATDTMNKVLKTKPTFKDIKEALKNQVGPYLYQETHRNPIIVPLIINKK
ncbi:ribonuclease J [Bacilli bacterium PM5-3]|nr:ribonuclease J [Bacilli bacterium PM5-3]MDH6603518.1 ribonuclease J [Bacilli bacterium PM5-9]